MQRSLFSEAKNPQQTFDQRNDLVTEHFKNKCFYVYKASSRVIVPPTLQTAVSSLPVTPHV